VKRLTRYQWSVEPAVNNNVFGQKTAESAVDSSFMVSDNLRPMHGAIENRDMPIIAVTQFDDNDEIAAVFSSSSANSDCDTSPSLEANLLCQ
jgi:hypothetical protein